MIFPPALSSDRPVIVYIDFKSPYAYLSIAPTRALERELGLRFDWRPFVLDIPSYLGSARLGTDGEVIEQQRSDEQWAGVKYAYYDCRRYAELQGFRIRGTEKIWDTNLVSAAMFWVRQFGDGVTGRFIDSVFGPFWQRQLDVESETAVAALLSDLNLDSHAFLEWCRAEGLAMQRRFQSEAFDAGIYGVPSYVIDGEVHFGREHFPRLRWLLAGKPGDCPDIANPLPEHLPPTSAPPSRVTIGVDGSLDSLLALPQLFAMLEGFAGDVTWVRAVPQQTPEPLQMSPAKSDSRSAGHSRRRAAQRAADTRRYGPADEAAESYPTLIQALLELHNIVASDAGPARVRTPAMAGIVIALDEELFIGRQHLPLIRARLRSPHD